MNRSSPRRAASRWFATAAITLGIGCGPLPEEEGPLHPELFVSTQAELTAAPWQLVNSMAVARVGTTATLLDDGRVLVAGASGSAATELFNPAQGTWSPSGSLSVARPSPSASKLANGQVLVTGGGTCCSAFVANADLFNPSTRSWTAAAPMKLARRGHTSTLLPNGKVLVTGGHYSTGPSNAAPSNTAELFDPATNTWSSAGFMYGSRSGHTATVLQNGKVLVVGGPTQQAELYDPATNTWARVGLANLRRDDTSATLLPNGKVLVMGGMTIVNGAWVVTPTAELFDPATNTWSSTGSMTTERVAHRSVLLADGRVLVAGGYRWASTPTGSTSVPLSSAELYDPATGTWTAASSMNRTRYAFGLTRLPNGNALAVSDTTAEVYRANEEHTVGSQLGQIASGTTCGARDDFAPVCEGGGGGASDISFLWTAPRSANYFFSTSGSSFDTVLKIQQAATGVNQSCNNDDSSGTLQSAIWRSVTAGEQLRIIVDGYATACGTFQLSIAESRYNPL
ncbi:MAG TPA: kelch repeat-containing protein [Myxococcaceae bacterium]|nr:kelch repeat-containing protein [Myxococcaceae bacterium]